jgi:hypothetical protein
MAVRFFFIVFSDCLCWMPFWKSWRWPTSTFPAICTHGWSFSSCPSNRPSIFFWWVFQFIFVACLVDIPDLCMPSISPVIYFVFLLFPTSSTCSLHRYFVRPFVISFTGSPFWDLTGPARPPAA